MEPKAVLTVKKAVAMATLKVQQKQHRQARRAEPNAKLRLTQLSFTSVIQKKLQGFMASAVFFRPSVRVFAS